MKKIFGSAALAAVLLAAPAAFAAPGDGNWRGGDELLGGPNDRAPRVQNEQRGSGTAPAQRVEPRVNPQDEAFSRNDRDFGRDVNDRDWRRDDARFAPVSLMQLRNQIERGVDRGTISRREGRMLLAQWRDIQAARDFYLRGGLNQWERAQLNARMARLEDAIDRQSRDWNRNRGWRG